MTACALTRLRILPQNVLLPSITALLLCTWGCTPSSGMIVGTALLSGESDHSGISVQVLTLPGSLQAIQTTGPDGRFEFVDIPAGLYTVTMSKLGFTAASARARVEAGSSILVSRTLSLPAIPLPPVFPAAS
jgi:hypothetical protein